MMYYSSLSKHEIFCQINLDTQRAFLIGNEGSKKITLWRKNDYIELTWPAFIGQTSFCGFVREEGGRGVIIGRFMPNHYIWIYLLLMFIIVPPIAYWVSGRHLLPACLSLLFLMAGTVLHFMIAPDIGKKGNDIVERFIEETLCQRCSSSLNRAYGTAVKK